MIRKRLLRAGLAATVPFALGYALGVRLVIATLLFPFEVLEELHLQRRRR